MAQAYRELVSCLSEHPKLQNLDITKRICEWDQRFVDIVIDGDQEEIDHLRCVFPIFEFDATIVAQVFNKGNVPTLKWVIEEMPPVIDLALLLSAVNGNFDALVFLNGICPGENKRPTIPFEAANNGHTECLRFLLENGFPVPKSDICYVCANKGHLGCIKVLHEYGSSWNGTKTTCFAANNGNIEIFKFAVAHGAPYCLEKQMDSAIGFEQLEYLKFLFANYDCPKNNACYIAAKRGNLVILKFLHENGCPLGEDARDIAVKRNNVPCVYYYDEVKKQSLSSIMRRLTF